MPNIGYMPVGGVNGEDNPRLLEDTKVRDAANFLFERGEARVRPRAVENVVSGLGAGDLIEFIRSFAVSDSPTTILITNDTGTYTLWSLDDNFSATSQGAMGAMGNEEFHNAETVNGDILIGNVPGGLRHWIIGGALSQIAGAKYRYVSGHLSRAIAAYDITVGLENPRRFAWSTTGDITDWASPGSGATTISDAIDDITALGVIHNVVVIGRRNGFHLAYTTGISEPAFRIETFIKRGPGVEWPATWDVEDNQAAYVGQDNVYLFDLKRPRPIGRDIRRELFQLIKSGVRFKGFFTRVFSSDRRLKYHLVPKQGGQSPHFSFDLEEETWSRHTYIVTPEHGFDLVRSTDRTLAIQSGKSLFLWDPDQGCEENAFILSRVFTLGTIEQDSDIERVIISHRNSEKIEGAEVEISATLNEIGVSNQVVRDFPAQTGNRWGRAWFGNRLQGQYFQCKLKIPPGKIFSTDYIGLQSEVGGEYRGDS